MFRRRERGAVARDAERHGNVRVPFGRGRKIKTQDVRQQQRVRHAVRDVKFSTKRIRQCVHRCRVHRPEAQPAIKTAERECGAGFEIFPIIHGAQKIFGNQLNALQGVIVHDGMREFVRVGFDAMRERVEAGRRRGVGGNILEARAALALGSLYGGLCLGPVNTAAVHALAYPLGGKFRIAHGVANALLLPHVLRFNFSAAPERHAEFSVALGVAHNGSALTTAEHGVEFLSKLSRDCGVPQTLSALNIPRAAIPEMAKSALTVQRLLKNNLREVTEADAVNIYEAAF